MHSLNYTYIITHCASVKNVNSEPQWAQMALIAGQKSVKFTLTFFFSRHGFFKPPSCGNTASCIPLLSTAGTHSRMGHSRGNHQTSQVKRIHWAALKSQSFRSEKTSQVTKLQPIPPSH